MELKVLNVNTWHGLYARSWWKAERLEPSEQKERRTAALIEGLRALDADVIAFQECFPQPRFTERVATELDLEHVSQVSNAGLRIFGAGYPLGVDTGEGSTILAKKGLGLRFLGRRALSGVGYTGARLSLQLQDKRMALAAEVTLEGQRVVVVTFHLRYEWATTADFEAAWRALVGQSLVAGDPPRKLVASVHANLARRDAEVVALKAWLRELGKDGAPVILAGDLNLDDEAPQTRVLLEEFRLTSVLQMVGDPSRTWDPHGNPNVAPSASLVHPDGTPKDPSALVGAYHDQQPQRPDHVFLGPTFTTKHLLDARVVLREPVGGVVPSDHYGILATVKIS